MIEEKLDTLIPSGFNSRLLLSNSEFGFDVKLGSIPDQDALLLYTDGLSNFIQPITEEKNIEFQRIELYFMLPSYWKIEDNPWPLEWIEKLAAHPQNNGTWYGPGDTIDIARGHSPLTRPFPATHFMLASPIELKDILTGKIWDESGIHFFGIIPISQKELDYKIRNSATVLTNRLVHKNYSERIDLFRLEVCRKRILGLF